MNYAVELYFDAISSKKIDSVRQLLDFNGVTTDKDTKPHISLAIYSEVDENTLIDKIKSFAKCKTGFSLIFPSIGVFPTKESVLFFAPKVSSELLAFHLTFLDYMSEFSDRLNAYYSVDNWVPHSTLGIHLSEEELLKGVNLLKTDNILPFKATFKSIGILAFPPNKQIFEAALENN